MTIRTITAYVLSCDAEGCDVRMQGPEGEDLIWQNDPLPGEIDLELDVSEWTGRDGEHWCPEHAAEATP